MPLTPYTTNIPLAIQPINQTQQAINDNFTCLVNNITPDNGLITRNHVGSSDPVNYGKHFFIQMPEATPTIATSALEIGLYCKDGTTSLVPELFFQRESLAADSGYAMTEGNLVANPGWCRHSSGLVEKWGSGTTSGAGTATVTLNGVGLGPNFVTVFSPSVQTASTGNNTAVIKISTSNLLPNSFTIYSFRTDTSAAVSIAYFYRAIGID